MFPNREKVCSHSCSADSNLCISGTAQKHYEKGLSKRCLSKHHIASSHPRNCWICMGDYWGAEQPPWPQDCGTPHCIVSTLPIYGAFLILFHTHSFSCLSLGWFHRVLQHSLMRGKNTTAMKSPRLLRAFFSKLALSSPPERFLQISVWGIVNTNFSLLKSPHIPAMLSFEWRTQGRPLNSFIVGFKTLQKV